MSGRHAAPRRRMFGILPGRGPAADRIVYGPRGLLDYPPPGPADNDTPTEPPQQEETPR